MKGPSSNNQDADEAAHYPDTEWLESYQVFRQLLFRDSKLVNRIGINHQTRNWRL